MYAGAANFAAGSAEHRHILARFFLDTHVDYVPEQIEWPQLPEAGCERLRALPFWQEAVATENITSNTVAAAAALEADADLRRAIEMQGYEENRHARLLVALTAHYRIPVQVPPRFEPRSLEEDFLYAGFGECFDSFFAFGLFAIARESGLFHPELLDIFEPVVQEEARHILFFVNWVRHHRSRLPWWRRPLFRLRCARIILKQVASRIKTARTMGADSAAGSGGEAGGGGTGDNFTLTAHRDMGEPVTLHRLLEVCLRENHERMARYDARLRRPRLVPGIGRFLYRVLPAGL